MSRRLTKKKKNPKKLKPKPKPKTFTEVLHFFFSKENMNLKLQQRVDVSFQCRVSLQSRCQPNRLRADTQDSKQQTPAPPVNGAGNSHHIHGSAVRPPPHPAATEPPPPACAHGQVEANMSAQRPFELELLSGSWFLWNRVSEEENVHHF